MNDLNSFISAQQAFSLIGSGSSVMLKVIHNHSRIESADGLGSDFNLFSISFEGHLENILNSSEFNK